MQTACGNRTQADSSPQVHLRQQDQELEQAATAVTEMTTAVEEVARNAVTTSQAANASNQLAEQSRQQVNDNLDGTRAMASEMQTSSERLQQLTGLVARFRV